MKKIMEQIPPIIHESWHTHLQPLFDDPKMKLLKYDILPTTKFYPESKNVFRVFSMPLNNIKVVIIGQDPYSNPREAIGLSFAVDKSIRIPPSLAVIKNEIINSKVERDSSVPIETDAWKELKHLHRQGVFLLNAALTVEVKNPNSHAGYWSWFTERVVQIISKEVSPVWLLWGRNAQSYTKLITGAETFKVNTILSCDHPAAEKYNGGTSPTKFSGSNIFVRCNQALKNDHKNIINW